MEPVAHFGFKTGDTPKVLEVQWPDGQKIVKVIEVSEVNKVLIIRHPESNLIDTSHILESNLKMKVINL